MKVASEPESFTTRFIGRGHGGIQVNGWCVMWGEEPLGKVPDEYLVFGREQDAQLAIDAMAEKGINSKADVLLMDRSEVVRICCECLMW